METAYPNLKPHQQERFQALGVLPENSLFDSTLLAALWAINPAEVAGTVATLLQAGLLIEVTSTTCIAQTKLYTLNSSTQTFAQALLQTAPYNAIIQERYHSALFAVR